MISYAQNFEDVILARALGDRANGFYVDIGACFPDVASVTRHFYELGWNGVNVEPMGEPFERLKAERPRDINVRAAVASYSGEIVIYHGPSVGESSAVRPFETARPIRVPCLTLAELCHRYATRPIDFLKIDVEGLEQDVVKGGDWALYRPAIVVLEVTMPWSTQRRADATDIVEFLRGNDYNEVYFDGLNAFFLAREAAALAPRFAAPPNVLDRFTVAREAELEAATARLQAHAEAVGRRLAEVQTQAGAAERESAALAARTTAAEQVAQQSKAANAELREALREKESLLLAAQRNWQEGVATVERWQVAAAKSASELRAADLRVLELSQALAEATRQAELAAHQATAAIAAAELRAHVAEARAEQSEARSREAEASAQAAVARAVQDAQEAGALALRTEAIARDLEARSREAEAGEHHAVARALQAEHTVASMLCSRSWRVTAPFRAVADSIRGAPRGAPRLTVTADAVLAEDGSRSAATPAEARLPAIGRGRRRRLTAPLQYTRQLLRLRSPTQPGKRLGPGPVAGKVLARTLVAARRSPLFATLMSWIRQRHPRLWMKVKRFVGEQTTASLHPPAPPVVPPPAVCNAAPDDDSAARFMPAAQVFARLLAEEVHRQRGRS